MLLKAQDKPHTFPASCGGKHCYFLIIFRIIWTIVVLGSLTGFVMIVKMQLAQYLSYGRIVNVEIIQSNELTYPAVAICNQNNFR